MSLGLKIAGVEMEEEPLAVLSIRPLVPADFSVLAAAAPIKPEPLLRMRARHHALAKDLANGMRPGVAAAVHGFSPSRVSILQGDPSFKELIDHYAKEKDFAFAEIAGRLTGLAVEAMTTLSERLEESPQLVKSGDLVKLLVATADRIGHGPSSKSDVNVFVGFGDRLRQAQERLAAQQSFIDITPVPEAAE